MVYFAQHYLYPLNIHPTTAEWYQMGTMSQRRKIMAWRLWMSPMLTTTVIDYLDIDLFYLVQIIKLVYFKIYGDTFAICQWFLKSFDITVANCFHTLQWMDFIFFPINLIVSKVFQDFNFLNILETVFRFDVNNRCETTCEILSNCINLSKHINLIYLAIPAKLEQCRPCLNVTYSKPKVTFWWNLKIK